MNVEDYGVALADAIERALPTWVEEAVVRTMVAAGASPSPEVVSEARSAGRRAVAEVVPALRSLLATDLDEQRTTPLALLRSAAAYPTAVLQAAGVEPVERDDYATRQFPDDPYDLTPSNFADLGPDVGDRGLEWGAAKAFAHKARHGSRTGG